VPRVDPDQEGHEAEEEKESAEHGRLPGIIGFEQIGRGVYFNPSSKVLSARDFARYNRRPEAAGL
jgi:hypothetical protein